MEVPQTHQKLREHATALKAGLSAVQRICRKRSLYDVDRKLQRAISRNKLTETLDRDRFALDCCALLLDLDKEIAMRTSASIDSDPDSMRPETETNHDLGSLRNSVLAFLHRQIGPLGPNLSALVGTAVAAKLLGAAGGLLELSIMPILNTVFLGANTSCNDDGGLIFTAIDPLPGFYFLYGTKSPFKGWSLARRLETEACRKLGRCINLAALMDLWRKDPTGEKGWAMGRQICKLIDAQKRKEEELLRKKQASKLAVVRDANKFKRALKLDEGRKRCTPSDASLERLTDSLREMGLTKPPAL